MQKRLTGILTLAFILLWIGGCTSMEQIASVQATADAALAEAKSALSRANAAHKVASEASYASEQAEQSAAGALECCNDNSSRLDRLFEKAMMK